MKFLIAGFGSIGRRHFRNLLALGERDIVVYRTGRSTLNDAELAGFPVVTNLPSALDHRPDAVIVANPTALHLDVAIPAAQAGCHLLLEKPVSHSLERVGELQEAAQHSGVGILVGFQFRFHPTIQKIAEMLQAGAIGRPVSVQACWGEYLPNWHPWENYQQSYSARRDLGGGVVLTLSHPLDYLRWLLGDVKALWAFAGRHSDLEIQVEDVAEIGLRFESGATGMLHLDYVLRPPAHEFMIIGTQGSLAWDNDTGAARIYRAEHDVWEEFPVPPGFDRNDLFLAELRHFLAVMRGEAEPVCSLEDGRRALQIALAVHESADQGRLVQL